MKVGERHFFSNVSVGSSPEVMLVWDLFRRPGQSAAKLSHLAATHTIRIEADRSHLVQADGEVIGHTPVDVRLIPKAIHVIMPKPAPALAANQVETSTDQLLAARP
jgi:hypothetical protein